MANAAADCCPFRRPFPADFDACPAFERSEYLPLDTGLGALHSVITCANLQVKPGSQDGWYYCGCRLGDEASRVRWANAQEIELIPVIAAAG